MLQLIKIIAHHSDKIICFPMRSFYKLNSHLSSLFIEFYLSIYAFTHIKLWKKLEKILFHHDLYYFCIVLHMVIISIIFCYILVLYVSLLSRIIINDESLLQYNLNKILSLLNPYICLDKLNSIHTDNQTLVPNCTFITILLFIIMWFTSFDRYRKI